MNSIIGLVRPLLPVVLMLAAVSILSAQEKADFILVKKLPGLPVRDRFQQQLAPAALKALGANVPFRVAKLNETLGDELTQAHRVLYRDETYFLVLDSAGNVPGPPDNTELLKNCIVLADTILVKKSNALTLQGSSHGQGQKLALKKGDRLARLFKYGPSCYLRLVGVRPQSGWSQLKPATAWEQIQSTVKAPVQADLSVLLADRITGRIQQVNAAYGQYFGHFNSLAKQPRAVPRWECRPIADGLDCIWNGDQETFRALGASTRVLVQDLENILLGKPFSVALKNTTIVIRPEAPDFSPPGTQKSQR